MTLTIARAELFSELAYEYGVSPEQAEWIYDHLIERGLIDYDIEKEVLLGEDEDGD